MYCKMKTTSSQVGERRLADFPSDIIREILSRLPIAAMLRFKYVCKMWYDIAIELQFINRFILTRKPPCPYIEGQQRSFFLIDERQTTIICRELPHRFLPSYYNTILGSCNGLLCLGLDGHGCVASEPVCLYNPVTRECVELPRHGYWIDGSWFNYGFGFDSVSKKYKIVCVYLKYYFCTDYEGGYLTAEDLATRGMIMTLGQDKSWRKIVLPYNVELRHATKTIFHDGLFHWLIEEDARTSGAEKILALDINSEKFYSFRFPPSVKFPDPSDSRLIKLADSLAIAVCDEPQNLFHIWRIYGSNTNSRWIKQHTIELSPGMCENYFCEMIGMSGDEDIFYVATEKIIYRDHGAPYLPKAHLYRYDPRKKRLSIVIVEMVGAPKNFSAVFFVPTLVSPMSLCCRNKKSMKR